jgi:GT2 family glycosyltransferase
MTDAGTVTVSLLNFNGGARAERCLESVLASRPAPDEVVVVDNASRDGSAERLRARVESERDGPEMRFLALQNNRGYGAGHNAAARLARGEFLAFLNASTEVEPEWLGAVAWMRGHPEVAFAQPPLLHDDDRDRIETLGALMSPRGRFDIVGRNRRFTEVRLPPGPTVFEVFSVRGAAFFARADRFRALGGFDESMFLYFEETDLCWRAALRGWRTVAWLDPSRPGRVFHRVHGTVPASFDIDRWFGRNRTLSMVQNLGWPRLGYVPLNVLDEAGHFARAPVDFARYALDVARGLPRALRARRVVQGERRVGDRRVFAPRVPESVSAALAAAAEVPEARRPRRGSTVPGGGARA